ncbi:four helix bundle protein [Polaribacter sp.]|uniref:four helix bundle protein n=1 Tax=Polaribacter sp. TaxID=1920175 RepID=UPI003EF5FD1D
MTEGFYRRTNPDFKRFLYISLVSNKETRSMLYLAVRFIFISDEISEDLIKK